MSRWRSRAGFLQASLGLSNLARTVDSGGRIMGTHTMSISHLLQLSTLAHTHLLQAETAQRCVALQHFTKGLGSDRREEVISEVDCQQRGVAA